MIRKYVFGSPIDTGATVLQIEAEKGPVPCFTLRQSDGVAFFRNMQRDTQVFGLGENVRGINKRGYKYVNFASDHGVHVETESSLYGAHNFLIIGNEKPFGLFVDCPGKVTFDVGFTRGDMLDIETQFPDLNVFIIEADSPREISREFRKLIGRSYIPPKWAFGYQQSRWSYMSTDEVRRVVGLCEKNGITLDSIGLDIDYMERYKDFSVNPDTFGDFKELADELKAKGIRLVPIIDAGVRIEEGYSVYEEGVKNNYFCKDKDGNDFVIAVWPGRSLFPDFLNPKAREWFGDQYKYMLDIGAEGIWNDMNEPTIFYSDIGLKKAYEKIDSLKGQNLEFDKLMQFRDAASGIFNSMDDYRSFYHNINGEMICHERVHNLFGFNMTRAAGEAFERLSPDKRLLLFSRSSYIGMHRYGGIWQGDNHSWWAHLLQNLKMMPSVNMCGFLFTGADIGGFSADTTEDLLLRWAQLGAFTPLMRNHAALGTRPQEPYNFANVEDIANTIRIRYMLLPYIYSEFMKCALNDDVLFRPLAFDYAKDEIAAHVEDQMMVGDSIMIAPVYTQNARGRYVYLPEDMLMVKLSSPENRSYVQMGKGHHYIYLQLNEMAFFLCGNSVIPLAKPTGNVANTDYTKLELLSNVSDTASYQLYDDDGFSKNYSAPGNLTAITVTRDGSGKLLLNSGTSEKMFSLTDAGK